MVLRSIVAIVREDHGDESIINSVDIPAVQTEDDSWGLSKPKPYFAMILRVISAILYCAAGVCVQILHSVSIPVCDAHFACTNAQTPQT